MHLTNLTKEEEYINLHYAMEFELNSQMNTYLKSLGTGNHEHFTALIRWHPTSMHTFM